MKAEDHALLRSTTRGTPMGSLLRQYWVPVALSEEVKEPAGPPIRVEVLGEIFIAFRGGNGKVGLVGEHCAHRGASLYYGRVEEDGIRCAYHGWKYCPTGACLDIPNEPRGSTFKNQIRQPAFPCEERGGVIFAFLGEGKPPAMPALEFLTVPSAQVYVSKREQECHWTQGMEGDIDPSHVPFLHASILGKGNKTEKDAKNALQATTAGDTTPKIEYSSTDFGILYASRRNAGEHEYYYRVAQWLMPWYTTIPGWSGDGPLAAHAWVPVNDKECMVYAWTWHPERDLTQADLAFMKERNDGVYSELAPGTFKPKRNKANNYTNPGETPDPYPYLRLQHFQDQDVAITESMGNLYDRTKENLAAGDTMIVQTRHRLITAARKLAEGSQPNYEADSYAVRPLSVRLAKDEPNWQQAVAKNIKAGPGTFIPSA
ncbi:MAG: rieske [2Fe-2S] domain protein [Hyphomicrobiales bacterium]|nr:rieske [2Fe-2S] domain protein [Hyphomicrobiales bacterium]